MKYIDRYLIDHKYGEWFDFESLDNNPEASSHLKGHIWKAGYQYRALENCVTNLRKIKHFNVGIYELNKTR